MRTARAFSESGFYHVIMRGTGKQIIFEDEKDRVCFMHLLEKLISESKITLHAYCLMDNHFHLLIHDSEAELAKFMQRLGTSYAKHYNTRHEHLGHVFQDRYKSEVIGSEQYYLTVLRYIIQNPLKAGLGMNAVYQRTSYASYFSHDFRWLDILDTDFACGLIGGDKNMLRSFLVELNEDTCMEAESRPRIKDGDLRLFICRTAGVESPLHVKRLAKANRDYTIAQIVKIEPSDSRIERETGVGRTVIRRIRKQATENHAKGVPIG